MENDSKRIAFGDIVGVETLVLRQDEPGVGTRVVPCIVVGGTEEGYILRYTNDKGLEDYTVSKDVLQIEPTEKWAEENGFGKQDDGFWTYLDVHDFDHDGGYWVNTVLLNFETKVIKANAITGNAVIHKNFCISTIQEVFSEYQIKKTFNTNGL